MIVAVIYQELELRTEIFRMFLGKANCYLLIYYPYEVSINILVLNMKIFDSNAKYYSKHMLFRVAEIWVLYCVTGLAYCGKYLKPTPHKPERHISKHKMKIGNVHIINKLIAFKLLCLESKE